MEKNPMQKIINGKNIHKIGIKNYYTKTLPYLLQKHTIMQISHEKDGMKALYAKYLLDLTL